MVLVRTCGAFVLLGLAILCIIKAGEAVRCFECNSHNDSNCLKPMPPDNLKKDCSEHAEGSKYILCRKIVQHIDFEVNGNKPETRIIRSCGWVGANYMNRCYQRSGFGGRQEVCACDGDYCNAAPSISLTSTVLSVSMGLFALHRFLF